MTPDPPCACEVLAEILRHVYNMQNEPPLTEAMMHCMELSIMIVDSKFCLGQYRQVASLSRSFCTG